MELRGAELLTRGVCVLILLSGPVHSQFEGMCVACRRKKDEEEKEMGSEGKSC